MKKTLLEKLRDKHELSETLFVRQSTDPEDETTWVLDAGYTRMQLLEPLEEKVLIGVYQLVGIEEVSRVETTVHRRLA